MFYSKRSLPPPSLSTHVDTAEGVAARRSVIIKNSAEEIQDRYNKETFRCGTGSPGQQPMTTGDVINLRRFNNNYNSLRIHSQPPQEEATLLYNDHSINERTMFCRLCICCSKMNIVKKAFISFICLYFFFLTYIKQQQQQQQQDIILLRLTEACFATRRPSLWPSCPSFRRNKLRMTFSYDRCISFVVLEINRSEDFKAHTPYNFDGSVSKERLPIASEAVSRCHGRIFYLVDFRLKITSSMNYSGQISGYPANMRPSCAISARIHSPDIAEGAL